MIALSAWAVVGHFLLEVGKVEVRLLLYLYSMLLAQMRAQARTAGPPSSLSPASCLLPPPLVHRDSWISSSQGWNRNWKRGLETENWKLELKVDGWAQMERVCDGAMRRGVLFRGGSHPDDTSTMYLPYPCTYLVPGDHPNPSLMMTMS